MRPRTALLLLLLLARQRCPAQTAPAAAEAQAPAYTLRVKAELVLMDASVTDRRTGEVIRGLRREDFSVSEDGVPQQISYLSQNELPIAVALLFDLTDTVAPVLDVLARNAKSVLSHLREDDEASVLTFSSHVVLVQRYTTDHSRLVAAISEAAAGHDVQVPTYLDEDVFEATALAEASHGAQARKVELWLTDGTSNMQPLNDAKLHGKGEAIRRLLRSGVVFGVMLEQSALTHAALAAPRSMLGEFDAYANLTGGPTVRASEKDAPAQLAAMIDALRQRYTLGYRPTEERAPGTMCHVKLTLSPVFFANHPALRAKDVVVRTREAYMR